MTIEEQLAALEERRNKMATQLRTARLEQELVDRTRLVDLEEEHGFSRVLAITYDCWEPGHGAATMLVVELPAARTARYKRMQALINNKDTKTQAKLDAIDQLARSCVLYPSPTGEEASVYEATIELAPGLLGNAARQIIEAVQGAANEEGKK